jgi:Copper type II ascorbate-dependent monooxygenase, C-terminal domain/Copper type II ascorbate-dependent monooxygenase, N-terminal domain
MKKIAPGLLMLIAGLLGCAGGEPVGVPNATGSGGGSAPAQGGRGGPAASGGVPGATGGAPGASGGAIGAGSGGTTGGGGSALPCDVASVLKAKCQSCHGATPLNGAPTSLMTYADTHAPAVSNTSLSVWQVMETRVHSTTMTVMPPRGQPAVTSTELASLDAWFAAGAPAGSQNCTGGGTGGSGVTGTGGSSSGSGGTGGTVADGVGPQYLPCTPTHTLRAHATDSTTAKYPVPNPTNDFYACFNFKSPFAPGEQATAYAPIIDDARVIHHWILYGVNTPVTDGSITTGTVGCATTTLSATHVSGWAPGGQNEVLDPDVGLVLDYQSFVLQVHYNNQRYDDGADASGVSFCTTTTPRKNAAGIVPLGSMLFTIPANANDYPVTSKCSFLAADLTTPITVLGASPHMHKLGTGFRTQHMRGGTNMGDLVNIPLGTWSFDGQVNYPVARRQVLPGDTLQTTCYYDNPNPEAVSFGTKTSDEMCFDFITVFPYGAVNRNCQL